MKGKVLRVEGYSYDKDGVHKEGYGMLLMSLTTVTDSDGKGNFAVGYLTEDVRISSRIANKLGLEANDLVNMQGKDVEVIQERPMGKRYEEIVSIKVIE